MKHIALSVFAAACTALSASALDATNARIWLDSKVKAEIVSHGSGMSGERNKVGDTAARTWQMVKIPVHVDGKVKGEHKVHPHFIPELKLRITLAIEGQNEEGKDVLDLLSKEVTYVDVPLNAATSGKDKDKMGENIINVGVFISPASAYKLSPKDGSLTKKLVGVAVEGTFKGSKCNRSSEKASDGYETGVLFTTKYDKELPPTGWWKKDGGKSGATLAAISETPFAPEYARLGFPATSPMYGFADSAPSSSSLMTGGLTGGMDTPDSTTGGYDTPTTETDATDGGTDTDATEDDDDGKGKKGKKGRKSRRSSRR